MNSPKRAVKVNMQELQSAFEGQRGPFQIDYYLDLETGAVEVVTEEERDLLQEIYETYADPETRTVDFPKILPELQMPDWQKERLVDIDKIDAGYLSRYIDIPAMETRDSYRDMEAFIVTVTNPDLQAKLERAIAGKGAFRYFRDVLSNYPKEQDRWYTFEKERIHNRIYAWLESEDIEPI